MVAEPLQKGCGMLDGALALAPREGVRQECLCAGFSAYVLVVGCAG